MYGCIICVVFVFVNMYGLHRYFPDMTTGDFAWPICLLLPLLSRNKGAPWDSPLSLRLRFVTGAAYVV